MFSTTWRTAWQVLLGVALLVLAWFGSPNLKPVERDVWLEEFTTLQHQMARHYANLDWMVSHRHIDLVGLRTSTETRLEAAVVRWQAEHALRDFIAAFQDPHLRVSRLRADASAGDAQDMLVGADCADLGYRNRAVDFTFPFEHAQGWEAVADQPFPAGTIRSLGVIRIAHFGEDGYRDVCERVGVGEGARATQLRVRDALQEAIRDVLRQFDSSGVKAVLVDITGNGGGSEWVEVAARLFTSNAIKRLAPVRPDPWCDRTPIWEGDTVCPSFTMPEPVAEQGVGPWNGPVYILADGGTASASEDFIVRLRGSGVAQLLGERTAGAGCGYVDGGTPARLTQIGLVVQMPNCARFTLEGRNEIEGLLPDIAVPVATGTVADKVRALLEALDL